ncbi:MAG TPA: TetR/AcrR family transcriptional regulator, partial [Bacteroidetes bacterium]|nr:TetR/AcrR family transcriptional regulator [Bacteroidota bacterium]
MKDTKTRILNAAEKLFSEQGIGATSLRSITAEAGVNLASIHYHFGSRENLILRVFERRLGPINAERLNLLNEFGQRAGNSAIPLEKIIEAFIRPPLFCEDAIDDLPASFVQLIGRMHSEPKETQHLLMSLFGDVITSFIAELKKALPEQSE